MRSRNSTSTKIDPRLKELFKPLLKQKKLTHFYIAWGSLEKKAYPKEYMKPVGNYFFDLASLTKVLATLPLVLKRTIPPYRSLEKTLGTFLEIAGCETFPPSLCKLSLETLLRHSSGLVAWRNYWTNRLDLDFPVHSFDRVKKRKVVFERLSYANVMSQSDQKFLYSDVGYLILGLFLEAVCDENLTELFRRFCRDDLGMDSTQLFFPTGEETQRFAPTSYCLIRERQLVGEVHDENAASLGGSCGHSGLFASGAGLVDFLKSYFSSPQGLSLLLENQRLSKQTQAGEYLLGWQHHRFDFANDELVMRHLGFTGTGVWIFPRRNQFITILTNRVMSSRTSSWIQGLRNDICKILWEEDLSRLELVVNP